MRPKSNGSIAYLIASWLLAAVWLVMLISKLTNADSTPVSEGLYIFAELCFLFSAITTTVRYRRQMQDTTPCLDAIVAVYSDWGIGCNGTQPIVVKADRKHFREVTGDAAVIVGRKTLADFPNGEPLKGRRNIVLTRQELEIPGAETAADVDEALALAEDEPQTFVIGGESVYLAMFPYITRVYVTKIDAAPESDAFFPDLDELLGWRITERSGLQEQDGVSYEFLTYERVE